ncbi:hypothetical protein M0805_000010 [Coniferiporia weirii]|nr:hypothetical protein M0805_000010 [Coniferiporia weirii]
MSSNGHRLDTTLDQERSISFHDHIGNGEGKVQEASIDTGDSATKNYERGFKFWMCFVAIMMSSFLMALDVCGLSTALPIIIADLHGVEFEWAGSAYALAATAFLPLSGGLAQVFGRKSIMLKQIFLFALGSAVCGAAPSVNCLIAGRTIQGIGAGGITSLTQIIISDLVPLQDRGTFNGLVAIAYTFATATSPVIGGALAQHGQWRWFFYLNIPVCGLVAIVVFVFLDLRTPRGTLKDKLLSLDWMGNAIVMSSTTAVVIGLTWGGIEVAWSSPRVLVPLILGLLGLVSFIVYEGYRPKIPLVPLAVLSDITAISGYLQAFCTSFCMISLFYYLPVYYQACKGASPIASGVDMFGVAYTAMPFGLAIGFTVTKSGRYKPQLCFAWVCMLVSTALLTTVHLETIRIASICYQIIFGLGLGTLMTSTFFPILAPIPVSLNANALAFMMFVRFFSQIWGVTVGGVILQNGLQKRLPAEFVATFPAGTAIAYSIIPAIANLEEPFRTSVRVAFAESIRINWEVLVGIAGLGFISSLFMKNLPLHSNLDEQWGLREGLGGNLSSNNEAGSAQTAV